MTSNKNQIRARRHDRIRSRIKGSVNRPRLVVFRSDKHIYAQLVDDANHITLASASDQGMKDIKAAKDQGHKVARAFAVGTALAKVALEKKVTSIVFDRGGYRYHGRVKALADGARAAGLTF